MELYIYVALLQIPSGKRKNVGHHVALIIPFLCGQCVPVVPNDLLNAKFMTNGEVDLQQGFKTE